MILRTALYPKHGRSVPARVVNHFFRPSGRASVEPFVKFRCDATSSIWFLLRSRRITHTKLRSLNCPGARLEGSLALDGGLRFQNECPCSASLALSFKQPFQSPGFSGAPFSYLLGPVPHSVSSVSLSLLSPETVKLSTKRTGREACWLALNFSLWRSLELQSAVHPSRSANILGGPTAPQIFFTRCGLCPRLL